MLTHNSSLSGQSVGRNSHLEINLCALLAWRCTILWESLDRQCTNLYTVRHLYFMEQKHNKRQIHRNPSRSHHIWAISATTSIITPIFCLMPFLPQPSQFILAWEMHRIMLACIPSGSQIKEFYSNLQNHPVDWQAHLHLNKNAIVF